MADEYEKRLEKYVANLTPEEAKYEKMLEKYVANLTPEETKKVLLECLNELLTYYDAIGIYEIQQDDLLDKPYRKLGDIGVYWDKSGTDLGLFDI